jgi:hypothetical protein
MNIFDNHKILFKKIKRIKLKKITGKNIVSSIGFDSNLFLLDMNMDVWNIDLTTEHFFTFKIDPFLQTYSVKKFDYNDILNRYGGIYISKDLHLLILTQDGHLYLYSPEGKKEREFYLTIEKSYFPYPLARKIFFDSENNIGVVSLLISDEEIFIQTTSYT